MNDLPEVNDDYKNILQAVGMLHIPDENIFAFKDIKYDKVKEVYTHATNTIKAKTKSLTNQTGIFGGLWF